MKPQNDRPDSEREQALVRVIISTIFFVYLLYLQFTGRFDVLLGLGWLITVSTVFTVVAIALFAHIAVRKGPLPVRRILGMILDFSMLTYNLQALGEPGAVIISLYLWVIVGNGLRYGQRYLYGAMVLGISGYLYAVSNSPYWSEHQSMSFGLFVGLVALPLYFSRLLSRLKEANIKLIVLSEEMKAFAMHDYLTGLPNRAMFTEILEKVIATCKRHRRLSAVLFVDLDGFKAINDEWGHAVGDDLLQLTAKRIKNCIRVTDTVARLGGDEFVVLLSEIDQVSHADQVANKLRIELRKPCMIGGSQISPGASIGVATYPASGETPDTLLKNADMAMYRAKKAGRKVRSQRGGKKKGMADRSEGITDAV